MPGTVNCMRCGGSLSLAASALAVEPPRASDRAKRFRRLFPWHRWYYSFRGQLAGFHGRVERVTSLWGLILPGPRLLARMIVPGWPQWFEGRRLRGAAFLASWLILMALSLVCFGSGPGAVFFGLMIAVHAAAVVDCVVQGAGANLQRASVTAAVVSIVILGLYFTASWAILDRVTSMQWLAASGPFAAGDTILYSPRAYRASAPQPGDVVLYGNPTYRAGPRHEIFEVRGQWIDRVLAGPGSQVKWEDGQLWVDGQPSALLPLDVGRLPDTIEVQVPADSYCIFPSTARYGAPQTLNFWQQQSIVPRSNIVGRAIVRHYPWWRWWWLR